MDRNDTNYKLYTRLANYNLECKVYEFGKLIDSSVWVYKSSKTGGIINETIPAKENYFNIEVVELCPIIHKIEGVTLRIELVGVCFDRWYITDRITNELQNYKLQSDGKI